MNSTVTTTAPNPNDTSTLGMLNTFLYNYRDGIPVKIDTGSIAALAGVGLVLILIAYSLKHL